MLQESIVPRHQIHALPLRLVTIVAAVPALTLHAPLESIPLEEPAYAPIAVWAHIPPRLHQSPALLVSLARSSPIVTALLAVRSAQVGLTPLQELQVAPLALLAALVLRGPVALRIAKLELSLLLEHPSAPLVVLVHTRIKMGHRVV